MRHVKPFPHDCPTHSRRPGNRMGWLSATIAVAFACSAMSPSVYAIRENGRSGSSDTEQTGDSITIITPTPGMYSQPQVRLRAYGYISESYDNNILDYSDEDRALFNSPFAPKGRFGISRLDDHITDVNARLSAEFGHRRDAFRIRLKGDGVFYTNNSFRRYTQWGLELRKTVHRSYAEATISWLPKYNLRNLYWRPMANRPFGVRYAPADFSRWSYDLELGSEISSRWDARLQLGLNWTNYNYPFDERDNRTFGEVMRTSYDLSRRITVSGAFGFAQSRAAGRDSVNAIVKDISYNARLAELSVRVKCDRKRRITAVGLVEYEHQKYLSAKPLDVSHYHRLDDDYVFGTSLSWRLTDYFQPELNYAYRMSRSSVVAGAADFGSYTAHRFGLQVTWYF